MSSAQSPDDPGAEQPFLSHLVELRDRLLRMVIAIFVAFLALFPFANDLYTYVAAPLMAQLPAGSTMIATQVITPFLTPFKLALVAAVFLAMPYLLHQLWAFVAPGLYQHEKRLAMPLLLSSIVLFYLGVLFAYYLVFPLIFAFLTATTPDGVAMMTDIAAYLDFVLALFLAFGVAFEIPVATVLLVMTGITSTAALVEKRPYVIVGAFVIGMLMTPPDVISQTLLAVPMWMLFELGVLYCRLVVDRPRPDDPDDPDAPAAPPPPAPRPQPPAPVGRELDPGIDAADRWQPLTADAMEAELDRLDAEDAALRAPSPPPAPPINSIEERIRRANRLRELGNTVAARAILYEILEDGDAEDRRVARDILRQLDGV